MGGRRRRGSVAFAGAALAAGLLLATSRAARAEEDVWREVGLSFEQVARYVDNRHCYTEERVFLGCLSALDAVAGEAEPPLVLAPPARLSARDPRAAFVPRPPEPEGPEPEAHAERRRRAERRERAFREAFRARAGEPPIDFDARLKWAAEHVVTPERESSLTARAINAWLARARDPHTRIEPYRAAMDELRRSHVNPYDRRRLGARGDRDIRVEATFDRGRVYGWIDLELFTDVACVDLSGALLKLVHDRADAIILDLRDNPGGVTEQAVCAAGLLLPEAAPIVALELLPPPLGPAGKSPLMPERPPGDTPESPFSRPRAGARLYTARDAPLSDRPLVVLVNARSASSAELVAGALQAHRRAIVVGERSYGKGTFQRASAWGGSEDVVLYETLARTVLPGGAEIQVHGIRPDLPIGPRPGRAAGGFAVRERIAYPNVIPPVHPAQQPACPELFASLQQCVEETGLAGSRYWKAAHRRGRARANYPRLVAADVLHCVMTYPEYERYFREGCPDESAGAPRAPEGAD